MDGLVQAASWFIIGATLMYLGVGFAKDLFRVAGISVVVVGLAIVGLAVSALADYPLWYAVLAVVLMAAAGFAMVTFLVTKVPYFQQHPDSEE